MLKFGTRALLVLLAVVVLTCLPFTAVFSLLRNWLADRPFRFWFDMLVADLTDMVGFFKANWRDPDDGANSGA
jgi:hypothetical protein